MLRLVLQLLVATMSATAASSFTLNIISTYGYNGHGEKFLVGDDCEKLDDLPITNASSCVGGMPKHAHAIKAMKEANENSVAMALGNMCFMGYLFDLDKGESCAKLIGSSGYEFYNLLMQDFYTCPGSYRKGLNCSDLEAAVDAFIAHGTTVMSTNIDVTSSIDGDWATEDKIAKHSVRTFDDGTKVGFVSVSDITNFSSGNKAEDTPTQRIPWLESDLYVHLDEIDFYAEDFVSSSDATRTVQSSFREYYSSLDVIKEVFEGAKENDPINAAIHNIKVAHPDCNIIVAMSDIQDVMTLFDDDELKFNSQVLFAQRYPDIDVLVSPSMNHYYGLEKYNSTSTIHNIYGKLAVVRSGVSRERATVTRVALEFDSNGSLLDISDEEEVVLDTEYKHWDEDVLDLLNERGEEARVLYSQTVVESKIDIYGERGGRDSEWNINCDVINGCRGFDCPVGRLVTSMMLDFCKEEGIPCDIAVSNGGGIRGSFDRGSITLEDIGGVLPFSNLLEIRTVKGSGLRKYIVEEIPSEYVDYDSDNLDVCFYDGSFIQTAGLKYAINPVTDSVISIEVLLDGHWYALDDDREYTMVNTDYVWNAFEEKSEVLASSTTFWKQDLYEFLLTFDELDNGLTLNAETGMKLYDRDTLMEMGCSNTVGNPFTASELPLRSSECTVLIKDIDDYVAPPFSFDIAHYNVSNDGTTLNSESSSMSKVRADITELASLNHTEVCVMPSCPSGREPKVKPDVWLVESDDTSLSHKNLSLPIDTPIVAVTSSFLPESIFLHNILPSSNDYAAILKKTIDSIWGVDMQIELFESPTSDNFATLANAFKLLYGSGSIVDDASVIVLLLPADELASTCAELSSDKAWIAVTLPGDFISDAACDGLLTVTATRTHAEAFTVATETLARSIADIVSASKELTASSVDEALRRIVPIPSLSLMNRGSSFDTVTRDDDKIISLDGVVWPSGSESVPGLQSMSTSSDTLPMEMIFAAIGLFVVGTIIIIIQRRQNRLQSVLVNELESRITLMQEYQDKEKELIKSEITKFKEEYNAAKKEKPLDAFLIEAGDIVPEDVLGKGAFGIVYKGVYRGQAVAIKTMSDVEESNMARFRDEILLMRDLRHENIVVMIGAVWSDVLMALVLEFCVNGSIADYTDKVHKKGESDTLTWESPLLTWTLDIAKGIKYIHSVSYFDHKEKRKIENIVHRDVKTDNCLLTAGLHAKIADFGEARVTVDATMTMVGTPIYVAPEIVRGEHYSTKADVYSFAMTLFQMALKGKYSLSAFLCMLLSKSDTNVKSISLGRVSYKMSHKAWRPTNAEKKLNIPSTIFRLIEICWDHDPNERPSFDEIVDYLEVDASRQVLGVDSMEATRKMSTANAAIMRRLLNLDQKKLQDANEAADMNEIMDHNNRLMREIEELRQENKALKERSSLA